MTSLKMLNWLYNIRLFTNFFVFLPSLCLLDVDCVMGNFNFHVVGSQVMVLLLAAAVLYKEKSLPNEELPNEVMLE